MGIVPGIPGCVVVLLHCEEQLEIVILVLVDIFTLCKCDSFPCIDKSKFHSIGGGKGVLNPPVTHSQILKLHLLVKKKKKIHPHQSSKQTHEQASMT